jgi:uncharacterized BrkB/YihY/UPF0761 family membrane protein
MNYKTIWSILRETFSAWNEHEAPRLGAALDFYTILSLAPLVILVIAIAALMFEHSTAQNQLLGQVESMGRPPGIGGCEGKDRTGTNTLHPARSHRSSV